MAPAQRPDRPVPLERWIERQYRHAAAALQLSISPCDLVKRRPLLGQTIRAVPGAIVASRMLADYDPDPDYFFHWYRDSALVIEALRLLWLDGTVGSGALQDLANFVHFSCSLQQLDGRALLAGRWRQHVAARIAPLVRADEELARVHGEAVAGEARVNADGTLDILRWGRPQHDGAALRALTLMRWAGCAPLPPDVQTALSALVHSDLAYVHRHGREPCFDIWEEELGWHYYTQRLAAAALAQGAAWAKQRGEIEAAREWARAALTLGQTLEGYWLEERGHYCSRRLPDGGRSAKELDMAVVLSVLHATAADAGEPLRDPRMLRTLARLEELFGASYPINRDRPAGRGPALGRYAGDVYYSGGAYYFCTLAGAELCYRGALDGRDALQARALRDRGDALLEAVRAFTPASGAWSEQFDQRSGAQTSAKQLAWSYAAFISCVAARRALARTQVCPRRA